MAAQTSYTFVQGIVDKLSTNAAELLESTKERFPPLAKPIDFVFGTVSYGRTVLFDLQEKYGYLVNDLRGNVEKAKISAQSKVKDVRPVVDNFWNSTVHPFETHVKGRFYDFKQAILPSKSGLFTYFDRVIVSFSDLLIRTPELVWPHVSSALNVAKPLVRGVVKTSSPIFFKAYGITGPFVEFGVSFLIKVKPSVEAVIKSNAYTAEWYNFVEVKGTEFLGFVFDYCDISYPANSSVASGPKEVVVDYAEAKSEEPSAVAVPSSEAVVHNDY